MFQRLDLFFFSCLFLTTQCQADKIPPPQNVSLRWKNDLEPEWSWAPPDNLGVNCTYEVNLETKEKENFRNSSTHSLAYTTDYIMEGGFIKFSVRAVCDGHRGEAAVAITNYSEVVKNLNCYLSSSEHGHCSWEPVILDVRFYYRGSYDSLLEPVKECSMYTTTNGIRTGCDLQFERHYSLDVALNGTVDNEPVKNSIKIRLIEDVRLPPLEWNVTKIGDKFYIIILNPPDIVDATFWTFTINYTECGEQKIKIVKENYTQLDVVPHCAYRISVRTVCDKSLCSKRGESQWSDERYFDADTDPYPLIYAAIILPLMFAGLAIVAFVCCRKNKEKVFPKVPEPRDLISDISDNNNKITVHNLYIPAREEENCKISLVIDPQIIKPNW